MESPNISVEASTEAGLAMKTSPLPSPVASPRPAGNTVVNCFASPMPTTSPVQSPRSAASPSLSQRATVSPAPSSQKQSVLSSVRSRPVSAATKTTSQKSTRPLSAPRGGPTRSAAGAAAAAAGDLELARVKDMLKSKEGELEKALKEIQTLKSTLSVKSRALEQKSQEYDSMREKTVTIEGSFASTTKEATMAKTDKKRLETQVADLLRQNARLTEKLALLQAKSPSVTAQLSYLQSEVRGVRKENEQLTEHAKALDTIIRNKDKEIAKMQHQVDEAHAILLVNKELENNVLHTTKMLENCRSEVKTLQQVNRQKESDMARMQRDVENLNKSHASAMESLSLTIGDLKATESRCRDLENEVSVLLDELARASAVASRAVNRDLKAGAHDDGVVPATMHFEEVKYLQGEIARLKEKIALLERDLSVSHELKEKFKRQVKVRSSLSSDVDPCFDANLPVDDGSNCAIGANTNRRRTGNFDQAVV